MSLLRHLRPSVVLLFAAAVSAPLAAYAQGSCAAGVPSVAAPVGTICGKTSPVTIANAGTYSASAYLGIPYAQPPVGNLRWQNPQALKTLPQNPFQATQFGMMCPQAVAPGTDACPLPANQNESCLFLNVWTPSGAKAGAKLPVMVFIHGGAFVEGSGGSTTGDLYDGTYLAAANNVIVVTFNYRLGALGFLGLNGLTTASNNNFGFRDQLMALQWVQSNIASFGGDPGNVTLSGESAGAMSVGLHALSSSQSAGLFQGAIMESNPLGVAYKTLDEAQTLGGKFQSIANCSSVSCLQGMTACNVVTSESSLDLDPPTSWTGMASVLPWSPAVDGTLITGQPIAGAGSLAVPMILGTNQAEGVLFAALAQQSGQKIGGVKYAALLAELFGSGKVTQIENVKTYFCALTASDCTQQLAQLITDYIFTCANRNLAIQATKAAGAKLVYAYQFTQASSFNLWPQVSACANQVCHGDELPYVFNTAEKIGQTFQTKEENLSQIMGGYWTAFAAGQNPNGGSRSNWPAFKPNSTYMILNATQSTPNDPFATSSNCTNLWDKIGYQSATAWSRFLAPAETAKP
jgi:carboxylesterase type B